MLLPEDALAAMMPEEEAWEQSFQAFLQAGGEGAASASHVILSQIFNQSPVGIIVVGEDDRVLLINRVASQMLEYEREERPDVTWSDLRQQRAMSGADEAALTEETDPIYMAIREHRRTTSNVMLRDPATDTEEWV
ncbi:PAS domain-containing protein, partial [Synergistaceae bacterium OttesenSCG-928-I11]|nr:PAS domain-containing protein [Synergistaceae bacterium OttesenSCG-928-I11]